MEHGTSTRDTVLVTGAAGFIGYHVARRLVERGDRVLGLDNLNDYYDVRLKEARLAQLSPFERFTFLKMDITNREGISQTGRPWPPCLRTTPSVEWCTLQPRPACATRW